MSEMDYIMIPELEDFIRRGLAEDVGEGDHTSLACIPEDDVTEARLLVKEDCVFSGLPVAEAMMKYVDPDVEIDFQVAEGEEVQAGKTAFLVRMNTHALLMVERFMLNTLQRMCAIATMSRSYAVEVEGWPVQILDTRKTTPHMRLLEKWAVKTGGCKIGRAHV